MPTVILTPRYSSDSQALWRAAIQLGWRAERLLNWQLPDELKQVAEPVLYLESVMAESIAQEMGVQLIDAAIDWLPKLPAEYRKRWVHLSTLGEARQLVDRAFIKPPNDKSFPALPYQGTELPTDFPDDTPVLISEIVQWEKEFRCFILHNSLKTLSVYLRNSELQTVNDFALEADEEQQIQDFITMILADERVEIPAAIVIDVGVIQGRGWAVVEHNAAWGAGLYGCDPAKVLEVLRYATVSGRSI